MRQLLVLTFITVVTTMTFAQSSKQVFPGANPNSPFSAAVKAGGRFSKKPEARAAHAYRLSRDVRAKPNPGRSAAIHPSPVSYR